MSLELLQACALISWLTAATPGPAVLLAGASILGLGVILHTSAWLFTAVKWAGAAYLVYLGLRMLRSRGGLERMGEAGEPAEQASDGQMLRLSPWASLTNPKAILFFGALFPQFVQTGSPPLPQFAPQVSLSMAASLSCLLTYV